MYITFNLIEGFYLELFNLKSNVISSGNQYYFVFLKNKHIFEKPAPESVLKYLSVKTCII